MKNRSGEKIRLASIDELLGVVNEESAMEIEISKIHPFKNHPFKVLDDEKMQDLVESVKINGVLTPVLLRMDENEEYEMVSGHRRMHATQLAGLTTIPAIVRELSDDDAIVAMVDANIQREELLPSEKAFAYKMKLAAMKRQAGRPKSNSGQNDQNLIGTVSRDVLAEQVGESSKQIQRYIRLTELIPELLDLVDNKKLQFTVAILTAVFCADTYVQEITSNRSEVQRLYQIKKRIYSIIQRLMIQGTFLLLLAVLGYGLFFAFQKPITHPVTESEILQFITCFGAIVVTIFFWGILANTLSMLFRNMWMGIGSSLLIWVATNSTGGDKLFGAWNLFSYSFRDIENTADITWLYGKGLCICIGLILLLALPKIVRKRG